MKSFKLHLLLLLLPLLGLSQTDVSVESILITPFAPYSYGNNVNFQITIRNNGPLAVKNISILDVVPCGLNYTAGSQTWNTSGLNRETIITNTLNPGESASVSISFDIVPCLLSNAWRSTASITAYEDINNVNIFNADTNIGNNSRSEELPIFDLALIKTLATPAPYAYGDTLTFNIEVHNQGNQPISGFLINDYLPTGVGYYFDPSLNLMWSGGPNVYNRWVSMNPVLNPGSVETVSINLVLLRTSGGNRAWVNFAEIISASDVSNNPIFDADSFYGSNSIQENNVLPGTLNDNNLNSTGIGNNDDDDDHDPAGAEIFDLALTKIQGSALLSFSYLQDVEYVFTIYNQGSVPATNIEITDYLSPALQYMNSPKNLLRGWNYNNILHTAKRTYTNVLLPGQSDTIKLDLMPVQFYVDPDNAWTDFAEISDADDTDPNTLLKPADIDSAPDSIKVNDAGGKPNSPADNFINGDGSGIPGSPLATKDEDDHDPHKIQIFDLALRKTKVTPGSFFQVGEDVVFQITVYNQGNVPAKNIVVSDYVPSGFDFIAGGSNSGWIGTEPLVKYTYTPVLLPGANTSFQITLRVQNSALPNAYLNYAEVSAAMDTLNNNRNDDADSVIDDDPNNDNLAIPGSPEDDNILGNSFIAGDQDDHDVSGIELLCQQPTLTVGIPECDPGNGTYSVTYYSNVANVISSSGTISGSKITGITLGTNVVITASNGMNCSQSLTVQSPANCPGTGGCEYPELTVGQPICTGGGFWAVSYSTDTGIMGTTGGTVGANIITNIPIGTNITVSASNGFCISRINVGSPTNCGVPCANSPITISGPVCETNGAGSYKINFTVDAGTNVIASTGTLSSGMVTGIPSGVDLTLTVTTPGCDTRVIVIPAGDCAVCQRPTLTVGKPECDPGNGTYSVTYYSNVANVISSSGTITGSKITGIILGANVVITASNGMNCSQILTVQSPANCPGTGGCEYPELTLGQPICTGGGFWAVSYSTDTGIMGTTGGTVGANIITNIPIGTNITVSASNGFCISRINVGSPTNCGVPCANSPITISGPICETNGAGTYKINFTVDAGTNVIASTGTLSSGMVTGIPSGVDLTLTVTTPGCDTRVIVIPAGDCTVCQRPTLTVGKPECDPGNGTYSVTYYSNVANISSSSGTISGSKIMGITLGANVVITASNGMNCSQSLTVQSPANCPDTGGCEYPELTVGQPICTGGGFWAVSYSTDAGIMGTTGGTVGSNIITNIPIGTNITVTSTNGNCVTNVNVNSPTNCGVPCANSPITISGPVCESNGAGTYKINFTVDTGTIVIASTGTLNAGMVTGIPSGVDLTLTVTTPGCDTRIIVVPAGDCNLGNASVGSFVWHDINGDGQQSPGEPGIPGVHVVLYDPLSNVVAQTSTGVNGQYLFTDVLPGDYYIRFNPPSNFELTFINIGDDNLDSDAGTFNGPATTDIFTLLPGENNNSIDAGLYKCVPIGDLVWYDSNKNDIFNITENGINGLRVNLWRNNFGVWQVWDYEYTGPKPGSPSDDGYFNFCAPPGTYFVEVIMPPLGLVRARADIGNNEEVDSDINADGRTNNFSVTSGQSKNDLGAGFYPMAVAGNLVWRDDNLNGIQDVGEAKVQGVVVEAIELGTGNVVSTAITDSDGIYTLDYLEKQIYYLKFTPPAEYTATIPGAASDNLDSDVDHSFGINTTRAFSMEPSSENNNIDMGVAFGILPVEWLNIQAKKNDLGNLIKWTVAKEWNVSHYVIERKISENQPFIELADKIFVKNNTLGQSEYIYNDLDKLPVGTCYYRVKQVDFDGKFSYSEIVYIKESSSLSINLYPNPAKSLTNLEILQDKDALIEVDLLDANGKFVKRLLAEYEIKKGENLIPINLQEFPKGLYMVRISDGSGSAIDRKLILTD
jgi:uncharacterized repeat protein (TIGR01451 family)